MSSPRRLVGLSSLGDGTGPDGLRSGAAIARCAIRRQVFHRRYQHAHLLPADLPGALAEGRERPLLPDRGGRGGGGLPALPALPSRSFAWHTGMVRHIGRRVTSAAIDRRRRARWGRRGEACRSPRRDRPPPAAAVRAASRRNTDRGRADAGACISRRSCSTKRRCRSRRSRSPPDSAACGDSTARCGARYARTPTELRKLARKRVDSPELLSLPPRLSPAVRLAASNRFSRGPRHARRGAGRRRPLSAHDRGWRRHGHDRDRGRRNPDRP